MVKRTHFALSMCMDIKKSLKLAMGSKNCKFQPITVGIRDVIVNVKKISKK